MQRCKDEWENTERNIDYDEDSIRDEMRSLLDGPDCLLGGYRHIWHTLKMKGISVPRTVVEKLLKELDPKGTAARTEEGHTGFKEAPTGTMEKFP